MNRMVIASALGALLLAGATATAAPQDAPEVPVAPATPAEPPAEPAPFPADAKIAYVDPQVVLQNSKPGQAGLELINNLVQQKQAEIQAKNTEIQKLSQEISANQSVWSASVISQRQAELTKLQNELQYLQTQAQTETDALEQQTIQEFQDLVLPIIEEIRQERGLWLILTNGAGSVVALDVRIDLSAEVIQRLDAASAE